MNEAQRTAKNECQLRYCKSTKGKATRLKYMRSPKGKEIARAKSLRQKYGLSLEAYALLFATQDGKCAICGTDRPGGWGSFHVDHNHTTGKVRGLLCFNCNKHLGHLEKTDWRNKAQAYLEAHYDL